MNLSSLNPPQREAVERTEGPLLILAGAGSGKTRVITMRIAYLVGRCRVPAENILAVTFTNKAAREMRERVVELVGKEACGGMTISTFHALCARILREQIQHLGYKRTFSIYGAADQLRLVRDLAREHCPDQKFNAERLQWLISDAKGSLIEAEDYRPASQDEHVQALAQIYPRYQAALKAYNALDFDDLLLLTERLFRLHPAVLDEYRERFRYVMVDEYQDTNPAQYTLLHRLTCEHRNLCVVGDDDQSIYAWRGADIRNILGFEKDYPGTHVVRLEQNYRSTGTILAAANGVIKNNRERRVKALWTAGAEGEKILFQSCANEEEEARSVVEMIRNERFRHQLRFADFAILYRSNMQSRVFEEELRYADMPYVLIGGQQFFDRKEVKDALAYLRVIVNPRDEVNLLRILNYPKRGIGEVTADRLIRASEERKSSLWEVLCAPPELDDAGRTSQALQRFTGLLHRYRQRFRGGDGLVVTAKALFSELGLEDEIIRGCDDVNQARRRIENLEEVVNALAAYVEREEQPTLAHFLEKVSLLDEEEPGGNDKEKKLARDAVTMMSLHASKGLEFPVVFLVGFEEELLPHVKSVSESLDVAEERRLCYVGITRAQRKLVLTRCEERKKYGQLQERLPSRFLEEIPADLLERSDNVELDEQQQEEQAADFFSKIHSMFEG